MRQQRIQLFFLILCLKDFLREAYSAAKPEFHTILSQEEIKRYLGTESHELVPDYDVVGISRQRTKRAPSSAEKNYRLSAFEKDFDLVLQPNDDVINEEGVVVERRTADGLMTRESHVPQGRFYVGHVASDPASHVAVRENVGQLSGAILSQGHVYKIEHLSHDLHRRALLDGNMYHVISRRSADTTVATRKRADIIKVPADIFARSKDFLPMQDENNHDESSKRSEVYQGKIYIEAMLTADKTTCDFYGNGTRDYLLNSANLISRLYKDSSIGMNVSWTLVKIFLVEGVDPDLDFAIKNITSAAKYLNVYRKWAAERNTPDGSPEHYDHSAMLTRRPCGLKDCNIDGLAYGYKPCSKTFGVSINDARGLSVAFTVAHEMAHNLGVSHDSKECAKGFIMERVQSSGPNAFHWSPCSRARLQHVFTSHKCFHNKPPKELPAPSLVPGYAIAVHEQCQMAFGPDSRACFPGKSCGALYCTTTGTSCYSRGAPVSEGTVCGDRKWCHAGKCTDVGTSLPPPIDGGWGAWQDYGTCTRTCGGGITYQFRRCNNPVPQYFGRSCQGPDKRFFKLCNTQECSSGNFRNQQCKAINQNYYSYKSPGSIKCTLICADHKLGRAWYFGHVNDGTRCVNSPHVLDVCIQGKCHPVGCDKLLGSEKVQDRCLKCGGDGSGCIRISQTYTKNYRRYGPLNGDAMVTIPKGATNVKIVEQAPSYNFISVKSKTTSRYYVPVPSWTRSFNVAGMSIYHYMKKYLDAEKIFIRGPTTEDLDAMFVYSGRRNNPGIYYEFYIPGKADPTTFYWHSKETECSATCAGGIKRYQITCRRSDDDSEVTPVYCDDSTKPVESVPCNMDPCPPQFEIGVWSPCSEQCGGGQQNRTLTCVQVLSSNSTKVVSESLCAELHRPAATQRCGEVDCMPQWVVGDWSECSVPCGDGGIRNRTVECKKKLASHTWAVLPVKECDDGVNEIPAQTSNCPAFSACHTWNVSYPCVSCGGSDKSFVPVGCFQDRHKKGRPLPELLANHRNQIKWSEISLTVKACAEDAWNKKYPVFGVQFFGECWSGPHGYVTYDVDGYNFKGCWEGVGKSKNNYVYAFTSLVVDPLVRCVYTPTNQTVSDDKCAASPRPQPKMKLCQYVCKS